LCRTTIYRWLRAYDVGGDAALKSSKASGPEPKLSQQQKMKVRKWILGMIRASMALIWTLDPEHCRGIDRIHMGITLGLTAVGRLLASLNITRKAAAPGL